MYSGDTMPPNDSQIGGLAEAVRPRAGGSATGTLLIPGHEGAPRKIDTSDGGHFAADFNREGIQRSCRESFVILDRSGGIPVADVGPGPFSLQEVL